MSDQLRRAEAALTAFGGDDPQIEDLVGALLQREGVVGYPPALIVRAIVQYTTAVVDQGEAGGRADDGRVVVDREERIEHQYAEVAGRVIGALLFRAGLMSVTDPMDVLSRAHQAFEAMRNEHDGL